MDLANLQFKYYIHKEEIKILHLLLQYAKLNLLLILYGINKIFNQDILDLQKIKYKL